MNTPPAGRSAPRRPEVPPSAPGRPSPAPPPADRRFRRLAARIGAAVRTAHSASVPF